MATEDVDPQQLVGLLADDDRRAVVAALVLGATTVAAVREATGLDARRAGHAVSRLVVLDWLVQEFEPGRRYPEREVNAILRRFHPDVAALRRYLVDEDFLGRTGGAYWRTGGTFDIR